MSEAIPLPCHIPALLCHLHLSGGIRLADEGDSVSGCDNRMFDLIMAIRDAADAEYEGAMNVVRHTPTSRDPP